MRSPRVRIDERTVGRIVLAGAAVSGRPRGGRLLSAPDRRIATACMQLNTIVHRPSTARAGYVARVGGTALFVVEYVHADEARTIGLAPQ
jgi:hypothetical protein